MTARPRSLLNGLALALASLAVFACSPDIETGEAPTPAVAPAADVTAQPEAVDPGAPAVAFTGDGGFVPKRLDIEPGTQVRFVNESDEDFWPASNIHPIPRDPPGARREEADCARPRRGPLPSRPGVSGAITIISRRNSAGSSSSRAETSGRHPNRWRLTSPTVPFEKAREDFPPGPTPTCWTAGSLMVEYIGRYGPENTVRLLKQAEFHTGEDCHQAAHHLGRTAYEAFGAAAFALSSHEVPVRLVPRRDRGPLRLPPARRTWRRTSPPSAPPPTTPSFATSACTASATA